MTISNKDVIYHSLKRMIENIGEVTVDEDFIKYRDQEVLKYNDNGRDIITKTIHCDCLLLEYTQLKLGLVNPTKEKSSDYEFMNSLIDNKLISGPYWNIKQSKYDWHKKCIENGELDYFAFIRYNQQVDSPLVVGSKVSFKLVEFLGSREALRMTSKSSGDGRFLPIKKN
jgi:hypothetical protein